MSSPPISRSDRPTASPLVKGEFRVLAVLSTVVGLLLLCENYGLLHGVHKLWPVFPAFVGLGLALLFHQRGRRDLVLLGIGAYLVGVSVLFLVLNYTSWRLLARAWPVFIGLLGLSSVLAALFARRARWHLSISGTFLVLLALVFYLVFDVAPRLWPVSLVLFGSWVLLMTWARAEDGQAVGRWKT